MPFTLPPIVAGEVAWRLFTIGLMALATWRLARWVDGSIRLWPVRWHPGANVEPMPEDRGRSHFLLLTLLVIPAAMGSARNGQSNLPLAALFVLAAIDAADRRWWRSTLLLGVAVLLKPIAMVPLLLLVALHPPMWWRSPIVLAAVAALPFARPDWSYVAQQYREGLAKVLEAGEPGAGTFAELTNLLRLIGIELEHRTMTGVRAAMALATLAAGWIVTRWAHAAWSPMAVLGLASSYLMLFNPRTEGNSYPILAPAVAAAAVWAMAWGYGRAPASVMTPGDRWSARAGWALVAGCIVLGVAHLFVPGGKDRVLRPLVALVFYA
ncbi:DUF2029 domain-containing protein [Leptolyngbya sp. 15MV]|nr:DUF2029 domain-containing protein [Leptolyngbya sp. 15MV]